MDEISTLEILNALSSVDTDGTFFIDRQFYNLIGNWFYSAALSKVAFLSPFHLGDKIHTVAKVLTVATVL